MFSAIIIRFWPVFIPVLLYLVWHEVRKRKARKAGDEPAHIAEGPWVSVLLATLALAVVCVLWFGFTVEKRTDVQYQPPQMKDGQLTHGRFTSPKQGDE